MEANDIGIADTVLASKKLQADDARALLGKAKKLTVMKGKKIAEFDVAKTVEDEAVEAMLGPTGNLRAPTIIKGSEVWVGFNDDVFSEAFS